MDPPTSPTDEDAEADLVSSLLNKDTLALLDPSSYDFDESILSNKNGGFHRPPTGNKTSSQNTSETNDEPLWTTSKNRDGLGQHKQPFLFRDWPFAILFLIQFFTILVLSGLYGIPLFLQNRGSISTNTLHGIYLTLISGSLSIVLAAFILWLLIQQRQNCTILISLSLASSVVSSFLMAIVFLVLFQNILGAIFSVLCAIVSLWYAMSVRIRIPYAASSLSAALEAIHSGNSSGLVSVALQMTLYLFLWIGLWMVSWMGVTYHTGKELNWYHTLFFLLSLYWTAQVFHRIVTVTVAGVVGLWWFSPTERASSTTTTALPCCPSSTVRDAWTRAVTCSLGSICFGSLLTGSIQVLRILVEAARQQDQSLDGRNAREGHRSNALLLCVLECILSIMDDLVQYFNRWAYIYVGLYGHTYLASGKKVISLFHSKGWAFLINDNLIGNTLSLMGFAVALLCGTLGAVIDSWTDGGWFKDIGEGSTYLSFALCFVVGLLIGRVYMAMVESAVDTIVVCFAEAPEDFEINHPDHCRRMKSAWRQVFGMMY